MGSVEEGPDQSSASLPPYGKRELWAGADRQLPSVPGVVNGSPRLASPRRHLPADSLFGASFLARVRVAMSRLRVARVSQQAGTASPARSLAQQRTLGGAWSHPRGRVA